MIHVAHRFFTAALIYFGLGLLAQLAIGFDVWLGFNPLAFAATTAASQLLLLGWLTQLALALVYDRWLPPTHSETGPTTVLVLFNLGLPLVILGQPGLMIFGGAWLGPATALGSLLQALAGLIFIVQLWRWHRKKTS